MPNKRSEIANVDHAVIHVMVQSAATENMTLHRGQNDVVTGPAGDSFRYAWKTRSELITSAELQQYGTTVPYGTTLRFGNLPGKVP